jgi:hypothetical protein
MSKRYWLAVLACVLPTFPLGYFWHLSIFADRYRALAMYRDEVIIPFGLASMTIQALLFAWAYPRLFRTAAAQWWRGAMGFGVVFGALAFSFAVLPVAAKYRMSSVEEFLMLETSFTVLQFMIVSPLIALAYRANADNGARAPIA